MPRDALGERISARIPITAMDAMRAVATAGGIPQAEVVRRAIDFSRMVRWMIRADTTGNLSGIVKAITAARPVQADTRTEPWTFYLDPGSLGWLRVQTAAGKEMGTVIASCLYIYRAFKDEIGA